ncbi:MAG: ATPase [Clostridia bacterium]
MANKANIEDLLDELYEVLDKGWSLPMSNGKIFVDGEEARAILEEIRDAMPNEIRKARAIVSDREKILNEANIEADNVMKMAEDKIKKRISQDSMVKEATIRANEIQLKGQEKYSMMMRAANEYVDNIIKDADVTMTKSLGDLRALRQSIRSAEKPSGNK